MIRDRREPLRLKRSNLTRDLTPPMEGLVARLGEERMVAHLERDDGCFYDQY